MKYKMQRKSWKGPEIHYTGFVYHVDGVSRRFLVSHMETYSVVKRYRDSDMFFIVLALYSNILGLK